VLIHPDLAAQVQQAVKQLLPGCSIIHNTGDNNKSADAVTAAEGAGAIPSGSAPAPSAGHGNFTIGLERASLRALPAFFAWMETDEARWQSAGGGVTAGAAPSKLLREWSLSNSTLEEVSLRLCAVESSIKAKLSGSAEDEEQRDADMQAHMQAESIGRAHTCMLCRSKPSVSKVTLYSKSSVAVDLADLPCDVCAYLHEAAALVAGARMSPRPAAEVPSRTMMPPPTRSTSSLISTRMAVHPAMLRSCTCLSRLCSAV
jgi:hypothetical protein